MKTNSITTSVILTLAMIGFHGPSLHSQTIEIGQNTQTQQFSLQGQSGGSTDSQGCGFISNAPNQVLNITQQLDYLKITAQVQGGQPTLLVDGPGGRFCSLADEVSGTNPEISGVWPPGQYVIYVGDRTGGQFPFTLNISRR